MNVLNALWPILLALLAGVAFGRLAPAALNHRLIGLIAPLIWLMLFLIGHEFGEILLSARAVGQILRNAVIITLCVTLIPSVLIFLSMRLLWQRQERLSVMNPEHPGHTSRNTSSSAFDTPAGDPATIPQPAGNTARQSFGQRLRQAWPPLREALIALGMVAGGALLFLLQSRLDFHLPLPSSGTFLLLLIGMVGIDLAQIRLSRQWLSVSMLAVPALVVVGSLLGGVLAASLTGEPLRPVMAVSTAFGWFSLSSVLIGDALGQSWGTLALSVDLFRELLAILLMYVIGQRWPEIAIGTGGATTMDTTLPIVKQTCPPAALPLALVSGFFLTLLAPITMNLFLA